MSTRLETEALLLRLRNIWIEIELAIASKKRFSITKILNTHKFFGGAFLYAAKKLGILEGGRGGANGGANYSLTEKYKELYPTDATRQHQLPIDLLKYIKRYEARLKRPNRKIKRRKFRTIKQIVLDAPLSQSVARQREILAPPAEETEQEQIVLDLFENDLLILVLKGVIKGNMSTSLIETAQHMLDKLEAL